MGDFRRYVSFLRLIAGRQRDRETYMKFQRAQARLIVGELEAKGIDISQGRFLELGCGHGGFSSVFLAKAEDFSAADIMRPDELLKKHKGVKFIQFDFERRFPVKDGSFDIVFSSSVIEHLHDPEHFLREIRRILSPQGMLILTFPPFYTPHGGHVFKPFHYFGERLACRLTKWFKGHDAQSYEKAYGSWGLFVLSLRTVERLLVRTGFVTKKEWVRFSPINFTKVPLLREFLSWQGHFVCVPGARRR